MVRAHPHHRAFTSSGGRKLPSTNSKIPCPDLVRNRDVGSEGGLQAAPRASNPNPTKKENHPVTVSASKTTLVAQCSAIVAALQNLAVTELTLGGKAYSKADAIAVFQAYLDAASNTATTNTAPIASSRRDAATTITNPKSPATFTRGSISRVPRSPRPTRRPFFGMRSERAS